MNKGLQQGNQTRQIPPPPYHSFFELPKSFVDFSLLSSNYSAVQISSLQILTTHLPS
jgi:hypothetical protein